MSTLVGIGSGVADRLVDLVPKEQQRWVAFQEYAVVARQDVDAVDDRSGKNAATESDEALGVDDVGGAEGHHIMTLIGNVVRPARNGARSTQVLHLVTQRVDSVTGCC